MFNTQFSNPRNRASLNFMNSFRRYSRSEQTRFELAEENLVRTTSVIDGLVQKSNYEHTDLDRLNQEKNKYYNENITEAYIPKTEETKVQYRNLIIGKILAVILESFISYATISSILNLTWGFSTDSNSPIENILMCFGSLLFAYAMVQASISMKISYDSENRVNPNQFVDFVNKYNLTYFPLLLVPVSGLLLSATLNEIGYGALLAFLSIITLGINIYVVNRYKQMYRFDVSNKLNNSLTAYDEKIDEARKQIRKTAISINQALSQLKIDVYQVASIYERRTGEISVVLNEETLRLANSIMGRDVLPVPNKPLTIPPPHHSRLTSQFFQLQNGLNIDAAESINPVVFPVNPLLIQSGYENTVPEPMVNNHDSEYTDSLNRDEKSV